MICRSCGQQTTDTLKACVHCGAALSGDSPDAEIVAKDEEKTAPVLKPIPPELFPVLPQSDHYERSKKCLRILLAAIFAVILYVILRPLLIKEDPHVKRIKKEHLAVSGYESRTWGELLEKICTDTDWDCYKQAYLRVVFTGTARNTGCGLKITFSVSPRKIGFSREYRLREIIYGGEEYWFRNDESYSDQMNRIISENLYS